MARANLTGRSFGRWQVIAFHSTIKERARWTCRCSCGTERIVTAGALNSGRSQSCGCARNEKLSQMRTTHGASMAPTLTLRSYYSMISRCYCEGSTQFEWYGERGIMVCRRWRGKNGFANFLADMGERPSKKHTIDRRDPNGNYTPKNCRWATWKEQQRNRRNTIFVEVGGQKVSLKEACETAGVNYMRTWERVMRKNWNIEDALRVPAFGRP
jgi:hypothetical protein